jgi:hypothetical protein
MEWEGICWDPAGIEKRRRKMCRGMRRDKFIVN